LAADATPIIGDGTYIAVNGERKSGVSFSFPLVGSAAVLMLSGHTPFDTHAALTAKVNSAALMTLPDEDDMHAALTATVNSAAQTMLPYLGLTRGSDSHAALTTKVNSAALVMLHDGLTASNKPTVQNGAFMAHSSTTLPNMQSPIIAVPATVLDPQLALVMSQGTKLTSHTQADNTSIDVKQLRVGK
jgi:hypothetical protein